VVTRSVTTGFTARNVKAWNGVHKAVDEMRNFYAICVLLSTPLFVLKKGLKRVKKCEKKRKFVSRKPERIALETKSTTRRGQILHLFYTFVTFFAFWRKSQFLGVTNFDSFFRLFKKL